MVARIQKWWTDSPNGDNIRQWVAGFTKTVVIHYTPEIGLPEESFLGVNFFHGICPCLPSQTQYMKCDRG